MDKRPLEEMIQADLDGELVAAERAELARLLLRDPGARRLHDEFRQTDRLLRDIRAAEPPQSLRPAILAASAGSSGAAGAGQRQHAWPAYRVAAIILGTFLIVGLGFVLSSGDRPGKDLQGSLGVALQGRVVLRSEGAEVSATLHREGEKLRLELAQSSIMPCEVIARIDPATMSLVGNRADAQASAASGQIRVPFEAGSRIVVLEFSGSAPIALELRAGGRLLGEGMLSAGGS